jgi:putative ABC transport system permease protein
MTLLEHLALTVIKFTAPASDREWIVGDVLEEVARIRARDGDTAARRMLVDDAIRGTVHFARPRWSVIRPPEPRGDGFMSTLFHDARYAMRLLRRSPGFTVAAVLTLALAIGANTAIFSAVKGVLISPLPYPHPERLVRLFEESDRTPHFPMSPADFRDYRNELQSFAGIAAFLRGDLQIGDPSHPEQLRGMQVTSGFFGVLGYQPAMGRDFEIADEIPGNSDVVILSHRLWMRRFNSDPAVVGRSIRLSGKSYRVVGVLPEGVQHVGSSYRSYGHGEPVDIWSVLVVPREEKPGLRYSHFFNVVARLRPGVTSAAMEADLRRTAESVAKRYPSQPSPWRPRVVPLKNEIIGTTESTLVALGGAATVVLLLACVNVAGLLLGRGVARGREIGVRAALGATRARLARQLLIESLVLATLGGAIGVALAYSGIAALSRFGPSDIPRLQSISIDSQVLSYALAATIVSALLFGLAPALRLASAGVGETLKEGVRSIAGSPHQRVRRALATVQLALAFVLVVSSGLLMRSFVALINTNPGFQPAGAITASIELPVARYDTDQSAAFYARAAERLRALPGIADAAFTSDLPWTGYDENTGFAIVGRFDKDNDDTEARYHFVTPGYLRSTGVPLVAGRDVTVNDVKAAPLVILINESAARKYWKSAQAAVGAQVNLWGAKRIVAGVIGDVRDMPWHDRSVPALYYPVSQTWYSQPMLLVARTSVDPASTVDTIRHALQELDPELPLANVRPLEAVAGAAMATRRLTLWLVGVFGLTALVLAVVGIYGVMAQAVGQRAHEFGIRQALGATSADILRLVFSSAALMTLAGLAAGVALALVSTRLLASLLYDVTALDPVTFATVGLLLATAAAAAAYLPARRASRIGAAEALRIADQ